MKSQILSSQIFGVAICRVHGPNALPILGLEASYEPAGVRPSPGAARFDSQAAPECSKAHSRSRVPAPEDGRTPVQGRHAGTKFGRSLLGGGGGGRLVPLKTQPCRNNLTRRSQRPQSKSQKRQFGIKPFTHRLTGCLWARMSRQLCTAIRQNPSALRGFWTAVAKRSGDTAFRLRTKLPKRRGASLPAAVQKNLVAAPQRCVLGGLCVSLLCLN